MNQRTQKDPRSTTPSTGGSRGQEGQRTGSPGGPRNAPERIPGQDIDRREKESGGKDDSSRDKPPRQSSEAGAYRATGTTGAGDPLAKGQGHPRDPAELPDEDET